MKPANHRRTLSWVVLAATGIWATTALGQTLPSETEEDSDTSPTSAPVEETKVPAPVESPASAPVEEAPVLAAPEKAPVKSIPRPDVRLSETSFVFEGIAPASETGEPERKAQKVTVTYSAPGDAPPVYIQVVAALDEGSLSPQYRSIGGFRDLARGKVKTKPPKGWPKLEVVGLTYTETPDPRQPDQKYLRLNPGESKEFDLVYTPGIAKFVGKKHEQINGYLQVHQFIPYEVRSGLDEGERQSAAVVASAGVVINPGFPLLSTMILILVAGFLLVGLVPLSDNAIRWVTLLITAAVGAIGVFLFFDYERGYSGLQYVEHVVWIGAFNIEYFLGIDGLSITMVILTAIICVICIGASWGIDKHVRGYHAMFLLLEIGMIGTFIALDFFLFYVFWEVMLLPMYFLIGIWGGPRREYAAIKFFLYTLAGSVLMLLAIIALYQSTAPTALANGEPARHTFDMMKMAMQPGAFERSTLFGLYRLGGFAWIAFLIGFAIKVPMWPFHTWLPDAHVEAPTAISVILAGVLLKMGTYGMLRMNFEILPYETVRYADYLALFGTIGIVYGALCAMAQQDLKKLVAYSSVSHMGYVLLGMAAATETTSGTIGLSGGLLQMFNHGTITAMLFLSVGVLYDRAHTRDLNRFGGVAQVMPVYSAIFGLAFFANLGLPGLSGFIGEAFVFFGAFAKYRVYTVIAATAVIITAAYCLWSLQRIFLGKFNEEWRGHLPEINGRELLTLVPLGIAVIILGFWPKPILDLLQPAVNDITFILDEALKTLQPSGAVSALPSVFWGA